MLSNELTAELRRQDALWNEGVLPDSILETRILDALSNVDANGYELDELFGEDVVSMLLERGAQQLLHESSGGVKIISTGREVDISHLAPGYRKLFDQWSRRGWILSADGMFVRCPKHK